MLTKHQLEDAVRCNRDMICFKCSIPDCNIFRNKLDCISGIAQTALAYRKMLEQLEWAGIEYRYGRYIEYCVCCKNDKKDGHEINCELAALLKESETKCNG